MIFCPIFFHFYFLNGLTLIRCCCKTKQQDVENPPRHISVYVDSSTVYVQLFTLFCHFEVHVQNHIYSLTHMKGAFHFESDNMDKYLDYCFSTLISGCGDLMFQIFIVNTLEVVPQSLNKEYSFGVLFD